jgi:hypothetical protein
METKMTSNLPTMKDLLPDIIARKRDNDWKSPKSVDAFKSSYNKVLSIVGPKRRPHIVNHPKFFQLIFETAMAEGYSHSAASGFISAFREGLREAQIRGEIRHVAVWHLPAVPKESDQPTIANIVVHATGVHTPPSRLSWWGKTKRWFKGLFS